MIEQFILDNHLNAMRLGGRKIGAERAGNRAIAVFNPYTNSQIGTVPKATLEEVREAIAQARACKPGLTRFERAAILNRAAAICARSSSTPIRAICRARRNANRR